MASTLSISSTITGVLNGQTHTITGASSFPIGALKVETFDVDTSYSDANYDNTVECQRVLIVNEGDNEVKVRIARDGGGSEWEYVDIPAGRFAEIFNTADTIIGTTLLTISIKAVTGTSRVVVLQAVI